MTRVHEELPDPGFTVPDSVTTAEICRKSGKLSVSGICSQDGRGNASYTEYFALDNIPAEVCDKHVRVTVCSVSGLLPSESCPKETAIRIAIPEDAEGSTDDSSYAMPSGYCSGHASVIVDTDDDEVSYSGPGSSGTNSGKKAKATFHAPGYSGSTNNTSKTDSNNSPSPSGSTAPTAPADGGSTGRVSKGPGRD
jgi:penicillin-binding protein 1A